jgi:hypothetical protein
VTYLGHDRRRTAAPPARTGLAGRTHTNPRSGSTGSQRGSPKPSERSDAQDRRAQWVGSLRAPWGVPYPCLKHRSNPAVSGQQGAARRRHGMSGAARAELRKRTSGLVGTWSGDRDRTGMASLKGGILPTRMGRSDTLYTFRAGARDPGMTQGLGVTHA